MRLYAESAEAEWASNTRIVEGDETNLKRTEAANRALAEFTGSAEAIEKAAGYLEQADRLEPLSGAHRDGLSLTARERDVLRSMSLGMSTKEIGRDLDISPATAKKHRENLMRKLGASTAVAAVREARRIGLVAE